MKESSTFFLLLSAFVISGCAYTKDVLQSAYDHKVESDCYKANPTNPDSFQASSNCQAIKNGTYESKSQQKDKKDWEK